MSDLDKDPQAGANSGAGESHSPSSRGGYPPAAPARRGSAHISDQAASELQNLVYPLQAEEPKQILHLYVLGKSPAWPDCEGACSGYLVQACDSKALGIASGDESERLANNILLDCGTGVLSQLQRYIQPADLDAVFISHLHADH